MSIINNNQTTNFYFSDNNKNFHHSNCNDNNSNNIQNQFPTHDNLFNSNISTLPSSFNFQIPSNFEPTMHINNKNKFSIENENSNKEYKEEKYKELISSQKKKRFMMNYGSKIKEIKNKPEIYNNNNVFIDEYIIKIKEIYKDKDSYYHFIEENGAYNFSECPFCGEPSIYIFGRVLCINKCFMTSVSSRTFNNNYTLSNFIEQYRDYYSKHLNCGENLATLYVDEQSKCAEFLCLKCEKDYLNLEDL